jgi:hypothetical protein
MLIPRAGASHSSSVRLVLRSLMAPFDTVLITNTVSRVPLPFMKNRSTPASAAAIPSRLALSPRVQERADFWDANAAEATSHPRSSPALVIVEPILTRLEAGNDRMPCRRRMLGCMLARRTVAASDVPALRTPAEMKPPTSRRRQAFHTPIAAWFRSGVDSALIFFISIFPSRGCTVQQRVQGTSKIFPMPPFSANA